MYDISQLLIEVGLWLFSRENNTLSCAVVEMCDGNRQGVASRALCLHDVWSIAWWWEWLPRIRWSTVLRVCRCFYVMYHLAVFVSVLVYDVWLRADKVNVVMNLGKRNPWGIYGFQKFTRQRPVGMHALDYKQVYWPTTASTEEQKNRACLIWRPNLPKWSVPASLPYSKLCLWACSSHVIFDMNHVHNEVCR